VAIGAIAITLVALSATSVHAAVPPTAVSCGQTLTRSVRLANDLKNCPGDGLVIGADAITVDLNGHTVDGDVAPTTMCEFSPVQSAGIRNDGGHDRLTINNGTVQQFANGIAAGSATTGMSDSSLHDLTARENHFAGITLAGAPSSTRRLNDNNWIARNVLSANGCTGLALNDSQDNHVALNDVTGNDNGILVCCSVDNIVQSNIVSDSRDHGILLYTGDGIVGDTRDNTIRHNAVSGSGGAGIAIFSDGSAQRNVITENEVSGSSGTGIVLEGADANEVSDNRVSRNPDDIVVTGNHNAITDNTATDALGCADPDCGFGIGIVGGTGNLIARNDVRRTAQDGIALTSFADEAPTVDTIGRDNRVRDAARDGFSVGTTGDGDPSAITGGLLENNTAIASGDDGFDIRSLASTLTSNLAVSSGDLGMFAVPGVIDGGHNTAHANANPLQCLGITCTQRP